MESIFYQNYTFYAHSNTNVTFQIDFLIVL